MLKPLYTNIPIDLGIEFITEHYLETLKFWKNYTIDIKPIPPSLLKKILEFTLRNCFFTFNGNFINRLNVLPWEDPVQFK